MPVYRILFSGELTAGAAPEQFHLPLQLALRAVASGFHFVAGSSGDTFTKRGIEARELVLALGANVDFDARFMGNGIHGRAAFNLADVKRRAWDRRHFCVDEAHGATHERVDGIGHSEIRPAVAAGAGDERFQAA